MTGAAGFLAGRRWPRPERRRIEVEGFDDERDVALEDITSELSRAFADVSVAELGELVIAALATIADDVGAEVAFTVTVADDAVTDVWQWAAPGRAHGPAPAAGTPIAAVFPSSIDEMRASRALLLEDVLAEELAPHEREWFEACDARGFAVMPIVQDGELAGVVGFVGTSRRAPWSRDDLHRMRFLGDLLVDAVARTRARAAAAVADARARRIADFIPDGLLSIDGEVDVVTWASPSVYRVTGWRPEELVRRPLGDLLPDGGVERVTAARQVLADGAGEHLVTARLENGAGGST